MTVLLENLGNNDVHRLVKPPILSVFGDIALAVGPIFQKYLDVVLTTLMQASQAQVDRVRYTFNILIRIRVLVLFSIFTQNYYYYYLQSDYDMIDYLNELREGCLEAYAGIIQGLKGESNAPNLAAELQLVQPSVGYIVQFITVVAQDSEHSDGTIAACAGLVG